MIKLNGRERARERGKKDNLSNVKCEWSKICLLFETNKFHLFTCIYYSLKLAFKIQAIKMLSSIKIKWLHLFTLNVCVRDVCVCWFSWTTCYQSVFSRKNRTYVRWVVYYLCKHIHIYDEEISSNVAWDVLNGVFKNVLWHIKSHFCH